LALVVVISFYSGFNAVVSWWVKYKKKPGAWNIRIQAFNLWFHVNIWIKKKIIHYNDST
jgi:hypothetical protein